MRNIINSENYHGLQIGAKAERLFEMKKSGINVPDLICVKYGFTRQELMKCLSETFSDCELFSVRSSALAEDGNKHSFAGQFDTFLNIKKDDVFEYAMKCFDSAKSETVKLYCENAGLESENTELSVIIQKMIPSELSGVIFTANPQGILNEFVVAVGNGTGNNVVEDKTAVTQYFFNISDNNCYYETQEDSPLLESDMLKRIIETSLKIQKIFGGYPDIEFAVADNELYILQARPITSLNDKDSIILDSSNISESYPGVSLPMTISFVKNVYYLVFSSCIRRLTRNDGTAEKLDNILRNMTDSANGRIYYRISGWYDVIRLLPFSKKIIPVWQEMLGVKDKNVSKSSSDAGFMTKFRVLVSFFQLIFSNQREMKRLNDYFSALFSDFEKKAESSSDPTELLKIYREVRDALGSVWDLTLVNDMYSFIFTGLLKSSLKRSYPENYAEITNKYISDIADIESMKPLKLLNRIYNQLKEEKRFDELKNITDKKSCCAFIEKGGKASELMEEYISLYGDRNPDELKLETSTCRTNPELLAERLINFQGFPESDKEKNNLPELKGIKKKFADNASAGIMLRERSRISRGRIFGLVRNIILKTADDFIRKNRISCKEDIFYITFEELEQAVYDEKMLLNEIIAKRREQYAVFEKLPAYTRIIFNGEVFDKNPVNVNSEKVSSSGGIIKGIPCSSGIAEGEVMLVETITPDMNAEGKIIVAKMTDPGWIFLIMQSKGIISEKGSLLSHTAIISRELKKPAVVGADRIFDNLHNGDIVRIDGGNGEIKILKRCEEIEQY